MAGLTLSLSTMPRSSQITMAVSGHTSKVSRKHISKTMTTAEKLNSQVKQSQSPVTHSMPAEKIEIFKSMDGWAKNNLLNYLKPVEDSWQPQDFLPEPQSEQFFDHIKEIRERAAEIPDEYYVCLVGDMITEEALPSYQTYINGNDGVEDETGFSMDAWAVWSRSWTSEENRHGDLLNKYLYLSGRVDMRQVEKTIQYLIRDGIDLRSENNPYLFFVYTSFQERATFISHANTARLAKGYGDINLAKICGTIAADEKRHEGAYTKIVEKLFELDPNYMMLQLEKMMRKKIAMPGRFMTDGKDPNLFDNYASVAQRIGVYTAKDYVDIVEFLVGVWRVDQIRDGLSGEGRRAQDYVCGLASRMRTVEERARERGKKNAEILAPFSWIFNKEIRV